MSDNVCWDRTTQSLVLSSYFYGQLVAPFISGLVTQRFGVKRPMALYMLLSSVLLMATPALARISSSLTIAVRAIQGFLGVWRKKNWISWLHWTVKHVYMFIKVNIENDFNILKSNSFYHVFFFFLKYTIYIAIMLLYFWYYTMITSQWILIVTVEMMIGSFASKMLIWMNF